MARPRTETIDVATPTRILDAATAVFARDGSSRATLADIATLAGLRRPSLLYHFDSKEALYRAVVERTFARLGAALAVPMASGEPFVATLEALVRTYSEFLASHPLEAKLIARELLEDEGVGPEILRLQVAPLLSAVTTYIQQAGQEHLREGLPVQAAVMQVVMDGLMHAATGPLRQLLWGPTSADMRWQMCRALFLRESHANRHTQGATWTP